MSRPIKETPRLNVEESIKFLNEVVRNSKKKTGPIPTPKINEAIKKIMQDIKDYCFICGSKNVKRKITSESFEYKGYKKTIEECEKIICKDCKESFYTDDTSKNNEKILKDFIKTVDNNNI